jgi:hypothetical protein
MPSPKGIYIGESAADLLEIIASAKDRIQNGDRTSLSGGQKSGSKNFSMDAETQLFEARYAYRILTGTLPPTRTYFDVRNQGPDSGFDVLS